jgi:hypothetical protein
MMCVIDAQALQYLLLFLTLSHGLFPHSPSLKLLGLSVRLKES